MTDVINVLDTSAIDGADPIDQQPDTSTSGSSFLGSIESLGAGILDSFATGVDKNLANGRMPFDPANPNVGAVRPQTAKTSSGNGLLLLLLLLFLVTR